MRAMRAIWITLACLVSLGMMGLGANAGAQDTHYWNDRYGPRAMLLGGAVIGSIDDMSATYYNPGALGYVEDPGVLLSANVYEVGSLTIRNGAGEGIDLSTSNFNILPNLLAGGFRKSWFGKNKFAYSLLTRYRFDVEVQGSRIAREDVLSAPGEENFAGALTFTDQGKELWTGLTWARGLTPKMGFGVTTYFSIHNQKQINRSFAQAMTDSGDVALFSDVNNFESRVYSLLWKAGVGIDLDPVTLGLTLTTPNLRMSGSGDAALNTTVIGLESIADGFQTDIQENVTANYKSPLSIGAGASLNLTRTKIHLSAEWFDSVDAYDVLELKSFRSQATGETIQRSIQQKLNSVVNAAAGIEHNLGESTIGYVSFTTDFSAFNPESDISTTGFDLYHVTSGATFLSGHNELTFGLSYAWGSEMITQLIDLKPGDDPVINTANQVELAYRNLTFIVGYSVGL